MYKIFSKKHSNAPINKIPEQIALGLGTFDGVHLGHQELIHNINSLAKNNNLAPAIITFSPLPTEYFTGQTNILINTLQERIALFLEQGIEYVIVFDFLKVKELETQVYLELLQQELQVKAVITGKDHIFGKNKEGNINILKDWGVKNNIRINTIEFKTDEQVEKISSSTIRQLLQQGNIQQANKLLGYNYFIQAQVMIGEGIGRQMDIPTYNLEYPENKINIPQGVYAVKYNNIPAIANYGIAPTLKDLDKPILECHLLSSQLPKEENKEQKIEFIHYIRSEKKFASQEELKTQILQDIQAAKEYLIDYLL